MIALVTGPPGSGKSWYAVRKLVDALEDDKFVATNVPFREDWAKTIANRHPLRWVMPGRRRALRERFERNAYFSEDLTELFRLRLSGKGEARGVMVLDEAHNWLNSRTWDSDGGDQVGKAEAVRRRLEVVRFFTQHRKLGWDVYLIAQQADLLDKQVRSLFEYHVTLRNLRRMKVLGVPASPFNLFLAIWQWHAASKAIVKREMYRLNKLCHLYDTFGVSHGLVADAADAIWLPRVDDLPPSLPPPAVELTDDDDQADDLDAPEFFGELPALDRIVIPPPPPSGYGRNGSS